MYVTRYSLRICTNTYTPVNEYTDNVKEIENEGGANPAKQRKQNIIF